MINATNIGKRIRKLRKERGLSQERMKTIVDDNGEKSFPLDGDDEEFAIYINPIFD